MGIGKNILIVIVTAGGIPVLIYMYSMPYEQWVQLFHFLGTLFWLLIVYLIVQVIWWIAKPFIEPKAESGWRQSVEDRRSGEDRRKDDEYIPLEFAQWETIDNHTKQVSYKGRSFLIWKTRDDKTYYQEIGKGNYPIGKKVTGTPDLIAKDIRRKLKEL